MNFFIAVTLYEVSMKTHSILSKSIAIFLSLALSLTSFMCVIFSEESESSQVSLNLEFDCKSVVLMEEKTGKILFEQNADEALPPASVTKIMTLLLVMEAIDEGRLKLEDMITASAHACSMGGSQIYLKEGEQMSAEDMIKSLVIASANDAAVALAEHLEGSEEAFVQKMNEKAQMLEMKNTNFENTNGLDDTAKNHATSARDIAIMSRELLKHEKITEYSSIWMDTIRNGEFGLTNTNRLVRFYKGATGLKTGSTSKAGFCISATAKRGEMELICVVMAAPTRDIRNQIATTALDWGFSNYALYENQGETIKDLKISGGKTQNIDAYYNDFACVVEKSELGKIERKIELPKEITAPIKKDDSIGKIIYRIGENEIGYSEIYSCHTVDKTDFWNLFLKMLSRMVLCCQY